MLYLLVVTISITIPHVIILSTLGFTREQAMPGGYIAYIEALIAFVLAIFLNGKWLARRAPQRELAVYVLSWLMLFRRRSSVRYSRLPASSGLEGKPQQPGLLLNNKRFEARHERLELSADLLVYQRTFVIENLCCV
jgi:hypothetical protein